MNQVGLQLLIGAFMVTATIMFHIGCLVTMTRMLRKIGPSLGIKGQRTRAFVVLVISALFILTVHIAGIWIWAALFLGMGIIETLEAALYFSTVTSTTVGYGDVVLHQDWRLLGSFQGMGGIILFGISTAFLIAVSRSSLKEFFDRN